MGRRKVEMKKITNGSSRLVTFSKRRSGLFKKANEISTLCAAEIAIVVFSPGGKPFSFGQPNLEKVVHRFQNRNSRSRDYDDGDDEDDDDDEFNSGNARVHKARVKKLNREITNLEAEIELQKRGSDQAKEKEKKNWELGKIDELSAEELKELEMKIRQLCRDSELRVSEIEASKSLLILAEDHRSCNNSNK